MREVIQTIDTIRKRIDKHKTALSGSEAMTRYALIDPMLRALDWDVSDPDTVTPEDAGTTGFKIDYAMGRAMVVEAKKFGERLDRHADQLIEYVKASKVRYGVLTNGQRWRMYDSRETMSAVKVEFDVTDPIGIVIQKSAALHRLAVSGGSSSEPSRPEPAAARNIGISIENAKYAKGKAPPVELLCPDATIVPLSSWTDIIVGVAQWLVDRKHLNESHCPVPIGQHNALFNRWPVHQDSSKTFAAYKKVGQFFVNIFGASQNATRYAVKLIDAAGQKPADFRVRFEDAGKGPRTSHSAKRRRAGT